MRVEITISIFLQTIFSTNIVIVINISPWKVCFCSVATIGSAAILILYCCIWYYVTTTGVYYTSHSQAAHVYWQLLWAGLHLSALKCHHNAANINFIRKQKCIIQSVSCIVPPMTTGLSKGKPASAEISREVCGTQNYDEINALCMKTNKFCWFTCNTSLKFKFIKSVSYLRFKLVFGAWLSV